MRKAAQFLVVLYLVGVEIPTAHALQVSVRERLERAALNSRTLQANAVALDQRLLSLMVLRTTFDEDLPAIAQNRFPRLSDFRAYSMIRPWISAFTGPNYGVAGLLQITPDWPRSEDAPALRALLADKDGAVRSLAIEALASLRLPEDVERIRTLVIDQTPGAPAIAAASPQSSAQFEGPRNETDAVPFRVWSDRTVGNYAWIAVRVMTGYRYRYDGKDAGGMTFDDWWRTHNLGRQSLWYWSERLLVEANSLPPLVPRPGEPDYDYRQRLNEGASSYRARLHEATLKALSALPADVQAKVFLATSAQAWGEVSPVRPVNALFPEGFRLSIRRERVLELLRERNFWPDVQDSPEIRMTVLARLARLAPEVLPRQDWPIVRQILETRAVGANTGRWMPVFYSRLLPSATLKNADDPLTREGYLRAALTKATEGGAREAIASEMVRSNLDGQWPALSAAFYSESESGHLSSDARLGILRALGEAPHSRNKLVVLVGLLNDPRNEMILTQVNHLYRQAVTSSLNAIAGNEYLFNNLLQDLGRPERSENALTELRRLANALLR
jgi:hypothetical protein